MLSVVQKAPNLSNALKATTYVVPNIATPPTTSSPIHHEVPSVHVPETYITASKMKSALPFGIGTPRVINGITTKQQFRFSHTDVRIPDYTVYRRKSCRDPSVPSKESADGRKAFTYVFTAGTIAFASVAAKTAVTKVVKYYGYNQDSLATGILELDISSVPVGKSVTFKWRNKPLFVKHRTPAEIQDSQNTPLSDLRDPAEDSERCPKPEWLIALGICTHLGCVPIANKGDFVGGYFCPCHGSHYDAAGRIRKGPAPENLELPPYRFISDTTISVG
uniref:Cytochrome b-c1 complex subunit Rieske, mitochondrial n=1 Tax=Maconellicoccus hirsutus TaxID=177089 RepID=A2I471_MACHI|nr:putative ubiquinol-cytochrome c reductase, Rieske iron-sulfur polypeptide 1 [Maconellicoccus hirsutus]